MLSGRSAGWLEVVVVGGGGGWLSTEADNEVLLIWSFYGTSQAQAIKGSENWDPGKLPGSHTVCFCFFLFSVPFLRSNSGLPLLLWVAGGVQGQ